MLKIPFAPGVSNFSPPNSYWSMIMNLIGPFFQCRSITFAVVVLTFICLIIPQFIWQPMGYLSFLTYTNMPHVYLETELVKIQKKYLYEAFTSIFFHMNLIHWFNNTIMAVFMLSAIEYMWRPAILLAFIVGISTNLYVTLLFSGTFMGLSGVLAGALGIYVAYLIANYTYLSTAYPDSSFVFWLYSCCFLVLMLVSSNVKSTSLHFIGLGLGILIGMGFLPRHAPAVSDQLSLIFKILSVIALIVPLVVILAG